MSESSLRRAFLSSPHHACMALATVGAGFASGEPLYLLLGATAYVLGWIYLPDMGFFRRWVEKRKNAAAESAARTEIAGFVKKRDAVLAALSPRMRERYHALGQVCRSIERATLENEAVSDANLSGDTRLRKLDELMWMYLRLLSTQQSLETFLESEDRENLPGEVAAAEAELAAMSAELEPLKTSGSASEMRERLRTSKLERLEVLRKRLQRREETEANLALVRAEQDRLSEQIKLIRADAVATRNAEALSARIDASVAHLHETNRWLSQLDEFKDLVGDLPSTERRIGFEPSAPPPLPTIEAERMTPTTTPKRGRERA